MQKFGPSLIFGLVASLISTFLFLVLDDYIGANTILFRLSKSPLVGVFVAGALVLAFFPAILTILFKLLTCSDSSDHGYFG